MLTGKYVDSDGIIYDPDGTVNEPATAAWAREVAARRTSAPYIYEWDIPAIKAESVQENSEADATRAWWDSQVSNVWTTTAEIPGRVADVITSAAPTALNIGKWIVIGLVAYAVIKVADRVPSQGHVKRYGQRKLREYRRRLAQTVAGD